MKYGAQRHGVMYRKAAFVAYDVIVDRDSPDDYGNPVLRRAAERALPLLHAAGFFIVVASNEPDVAYGRLTERALEERGMRLNESFAQAAAPLTAFRYCPHDARGSETIYAFDCDCRMPEAGMLLQAAAELRINVTTSWMIGNLLDHVEAAHATGCRSVLVDDGAERAWRTEDSRHADVIAEDLVEAAVVVATATRGGIRAKARQGDGGG